MVAEATVMTLETFLTTITTIITQVTNWVVTMLGVITSNPILLLSCGVAMTATVIGFLKRIFRF